MNHRLIGQALCSPLFFSRQARSKGGKNLNDNQEIILQRAFVRRLNFIRSFFVWPVSLLLRVKQERNKGT